MGNDEDRERELRCPDCGWARSFSSGAWRCEQCGSPLDWNPDPVSPLSTINESQTGPARYAAALPPLPNWISIGDAFTPITSISLQDREVLVKLDSLQSTGSFKDRGNRVVVSAMNTLNPHRLVEDSSGNAASSLAGYAAKAGIPCTVYAPETASPGKLVQARAYGANVVPVLGSRSDVAKAAIAAHHPTEGIFYASHNWHPFFIAGVGTWVLEAWEQLDGRLPANLIVPVGSGSALLGAHMMLKWLLARNEIPALPRLWAAQPQACSPVVNAFLAGQQELDLVAPQPSLAEGAAIAKPVRGARILSAIRQSNGGAFAISEPEIVQSLKHAAVQGVYMEPTSALAVAAAKRLLATDSSIANNDVLVLITGNGMKATDAISPLLS